jgi:hypothetical protein
MDHGLRSASGGGRQNGVAPLVNTRNLAAAVVSVATGMAAAAVLPSAAYATVHAFTYKSGNGRRSQRICDKSSTGDRCDSAQFGSLSDDHAHWNACEQYYVSSSGPNHSYRSRFYTKYTCGYDQSFHINRGPNESYGEVGEAWADANHVACGYVWARVTSYLSGLSPYKQINSCTP